MRKQWLFLFVIITFIGTGIAVSAEITNNDRNSSITENNRRYLNEEDITFYYEINKDDTITILNFSSETRSLIYNYQEEDSEDEDISERKVNYIETLVIPGKMKVNGKTYVVSTIKSSDFYCGNIGNIIIEEGISNILEESFRGEVKSISLPSTLKRIDSKAFYEFSAENIIISEKSPYFTVQNNIIFNKDKTEIVWAPNVKNTYAIPKSVTKIGGGAFRSSYQLKKINMHQNVSYIGDYAFALLQDLSVVFPDQLNYIGKGSFQYTFFKDINKFPKVKKIGLYAFQGSNITNIVLPEGVKEIEEGAFLECSYVKKLHIPASVEKIGKRAFQFDGVDEIYDYDSRLKNKDITINNKNKYYTIKNGCLLNKNGSLLIQVLSAEKNLLVPDSVKTINKNAMQYNFTVEKVVINNNCKVIPEYAFQNCPNLKTIVIPASIIEIKQGALETTPEEEKRDIIFKGKKPPKIYRNLPIEFSSASEIDWEYYADSIQFPRDIIVPKSCLEIYKKEFDKVKFIYGTMKEDINK